MKPNQSTGQLLKATDLANYLNVHRATVYRLAQYKVIPFIYIGNTMRFDLNAVMEALENKQSELLKYSTAQ